MPRTLRPVDRAPSQHPVRAVDEGEAHVSFFSYESDDNETTALVDAVPP
jgi:hypothetical protein